MVVIEAEGQLLQMAEQIQTHLGLHTHTDQMTVVLHKVAQQHTDDVQRQHHQTGDNDGGIHLLRNVHIEHIARHNGIYHADNRDQQGCQQIQDQQLLMGFVVVDKSF